MSWRKIPMKFAGKCIVCNEPIEINEIGLWAKGLGVKHEKCAEPQERNCIVCGGPAGCTVCEFIEECNLDKVSELCICKKCSDTKDSFASYQSAIKKKFHVLNT